MLRSRRIPLTPATHRLLLLCAVAAIAFNVNQASGSDTLKDGSRVASRWSVTGGNRGMLGSQPDNRPIEFTGIAIWEVRDGKLAHNWMERSAYELAGKQRSR
jgi:hypothetical protein